MADRVPCKVHATWVCHGCWDWRRKGAVRQEHQWCPKCGSTEGHFKDVHHRNGRSCEV